MEWKHGLLRGKTWETDENLEPIEIY